MKNNLSNVSAHSPQFIEGLVESVQSDWTSPSLMNAGFN